MTIKHKRETRQIDYKESWPLANYNSSNKQTYSQMVFLKLIPKIEQKVPIKYPPINII